MDVHHGGSGTMDFGMGNVHQSCIMGTSWKRMEYGVCDVRGHHGTVCVLQMQPLSEKA